MADAIHRAPTYCTAKLMAATPPAIFLQLAPFHNNSGGNGHFRHLPLTGLRSKLLLNMAEKNMAHSEYSLLSPINATTPTLTHNLPDSGATK